MRLAALTTRVIAAVVEEPMATESAVADGSVMAAGSGTIGADGYLPDAGNPADLRGKRGLLVPRRPRQTDRDDGIFFKAQIGVDHVVDLSPHHDRADNKDQADGKLEDDEALAQVTLGV